MKFAPNILSGLVLIVISIVMFSMGKCVGVKSTYSTAVNADTIRYYRDDNNALHAEIRRYESSIEEAGEFYKHTLDSVAKELNTKSSKIESILSVKATKTGTAKGNVLSSNPCTDTIYIPFNFEGESISGTGEIIHDTVKLKYKVDLSLDFVEHWKRKNFLSKKEHYLDGSSKDTSVKITGIQNITVDYEYSRWGVSAFGGFDVINMRPAAGVALTFDILRFGRKRIRK